MNNFQIHYECKKVLANTIIVMSISDFLSYTMVLLITLR